MRQSSLLTSLLSATVVTTAAASSTVAPSRLAHTYSIVARDPATGELGVGVQSHWFSVGPSVAWAEAGVGAVATQSLVEVSYGPLGLELMRIGKSAPQTLAGLLAADPQAAVRQVAMIDNDGRVAVHTGKGCIDAAGHLVGDNYSVQANLMVDESVWPAMSRAFEAAEGDLAARILAALEAAQASGGDIRGRQSAAILVVAGKPSGRPWQDRKFDLRVEDHPTPVAELRRLVRLQRAYLHMNEGDDRMAKNDVDGALLAYAAAEKLAPDNIEVVFWHAASLVSAGRVEQSLPLLERVFAADKNWITLVPRLRKAGFLPDDDAVIEKMLTAAE